jgi:hypothetical protein
VRERRDSAAVEQALKALTKAAGEDQRADNNLLGLAVDAARARATVGEISDALEAVWGRHTASGVESSLLGQFLARSQMYCLGTYLISYVLSGDRSQMYWKQSG